MYQNDCSGIAVVYQAWGGQHNSVAVVEMFFESYRSFKAGCPHDLVVVFSGWHDAKAEEHVKRIALQFTDKLVFLPENGLDLGMYMYVSNTLPQKLVCFMSMNSRPSDNGWLSKMQLALIGNPMVGLVGPTGSFGTIAGFQIPSIRFCNLKEVGKTLLFPVRLVYHLSCYLLKLCHFPRFPNPHIRTSTFVVRKSLFLEFAQVSKFPKNKYETYRLESGRWGLTRFMLTNGHKVRVVGRDGIAYGIAEWKGSRTFRCENQENLLVEDRQTQIYHHANLEGRLALEKAAWGE